MKIKIIDNFLDAEDFEKLCSIQLDEINSDEIQVFHNEIHNNEIIKTSKIDKNFLIKLNEKYLIKAFDILKELEPYKFNLYEYTDFTLIHTGSHYKFPIHDDTPDKLLSGVIYLKPEINSGTLFYSSKDGQNEREIEWKQNRAVFFSRKERETWHSYEGDGINNRVVLVYNLVSNKIKDVFKAENKNYFFGNFRLKYNPYIYKIFKTTI